jgi:hypothetical protein
MSWLAALIVTLGLVSSAQDEGGCRKVTEYNRDGRAYEVEVCEGSGRATAARTATGGRRYRPGELVRVVSAVDGQQCAIWATRNSPQGQAATTSQHDYQIVGDIFDTSVWDIWQQMIAAMPHCRHADAAQQAVYAFLHEYPTPHPDPHIAPGAAITGQPGYLHTRGPATHTPAPIATPQGTLTVTFTAADLTIDWGDHSPPETHPAPTHPWPDGTATHTWTHTGTYTIVVVARWHVDWQLGTQHGTVTLTGPPATIDNFPVTQLQAIRTR